MFGCCFLGMSSALSRWCRIVILITAVVRQDRELCSAPRDEFYRFPRSNALSALGMIRFLVAELVRTRDEMANLSFESAHKRVATLLLHLVPGDGAVAEHSPFVNLPLPPGTRRNP